MLTTITKISYLGYDLEAATNWNSENIMDLTIYEKTKEMNPNQRACLYSYRNNSDRMDDGNCYELTSKNNMGTKDSNRSYNQFAINQK